MITMITTGEKRVRTWNTQIKSVVAVVALLYPFYTLFIIDYLPERQDVLSRKCKKSKYDKNGRS